MLWFFQNLPRPLRRGGCSQWPNMQRWILAIVFVPFFCLLNAGGLTLLLRTPERAFRLHNLLLLANHRGKIDLPYGKLSVSTDATVTLSDKLASLLDVSDFVTDPKPENESLFLFSA